MDPLEYIDRAKMKSRIHKDKMITPLGKKDYYIYVEDKGKGGFYEELLENIYDRKFEIYDEYSGKTNLLKHYFELKDNGELTDNQIFLLDRDYEFLNKDQNYKTLCSKTFSEIEKESNIRILKRTNIENYLLLLEKKEEGYKNFIKALRKCTCKTRGTLEDIIPYTVYLKIICRMCHLSFVYMINQCFNGNFIKEKPYIDYETLRYTGVYFENIKNFKIYYDGVKLEYKHLLKGIEFIDFNLALIKLKEQFYDAYLHIDMKQVLYQLLQYIRNKKIKVDSEILKMELLNSQSDEIKDELRAILNID